MFDEREVGELMQSLATDLENYAADMIKAANVARNMVEMQANLSDLKARYDMAIFEGKNEVERKAARLMAESKDEELKAVKAYIQNLTTAEDGQIMLETRTKILSKKILAKNALLEVIANWQKTTNGSKANGTSSRTLQDKSILAPNGRQDYSNCFQI